MKTIINNYYNAIRKKINDSVLPDSPLAWQVHRHLTDRALPVTLLLPIATTLGTPQQVNTAVSVSAALAYLLLANRWLDDMHDRDRPDQLWKELGEAKVAMLSANALNHAWGCLVRETEVPRQLLAEFGDMIAVIALGEHVDVTSPPEDFTSWQRNAWCKTAVTFRFAAKAGAMLKGDPRWQEAASRYGELLGLALQAADDFDGVFDSGAPDFHSGAMGTLPAVLLLEAGVERDRLKEMIEARRVASLLALVEQYSIRQAMDKHIANYGEQAAGVLIAAGIRPRTHHLARFLHALCRM
jgi:geranylgeranyl pyrophosphate synthase